MKPTNNTARLAGVLYLLLAFAPFSLLYVPGKLIVRGNAALTAQNILASEQLLRFGMAFELVTGIVSIYLLMVLYRLFNRVDKMQASLMVILGCLVSVPITFISVAFQYAALTLVKRPDYLTVFDKRQSDAMALFFLGLHDKGILFNMIFWGLWLFPFGVLVMKSGWFPKILGILLIVNGCAYLAQSFTGLLLPDYAPFVNRWAFIPETGEVWILLWLLIKGAKVEPVAQMTPERALA